MDEYNKLFALVRETDLLENWEKLELKRYLIKVDKYKSTLDKIKKILKECKMLIPHEFDWDEQTDNILKLLEEVEVLEKKKFTKEDFIKEAMDLENITREQFNKKYEVKECNCEREFCKGFIKVEKVQEEKKIPEKSILDIDSDVNGSYDTVIINDAEYQISRVERYILGKINEIIDYLDYLKSKGDE